ncbi:uncharacterized protein G2W53_014367 [Senna tora]|uniref:Uncharacterized protein n=1 Tax=Senna tora TaxID=362788 RepID=A0A835C415_9FABA|nr:uncharacterized protein G2W53_014367 [Senna tora]
MEWEERGSCLNIFQMTNRGQISETFTNYEAKDLLRKNVRELRGKRLGAQLSQTRRFALYLRIGVVLMLQLESSWRGRSVDHVLTYSGQQIAVGSQKPSRITRNLQELRGKRLVAQGSQTRRFALYIRTGVVLMLQLESSPHARSVDHVSTYSGRQIAVGSQKPSRITRQKTCCASESNTSFRIVLANRSGFDAPIGVVMALVERGSSLNIFRMANRGQISETFMNYEAKDLLGESSTSVRVVFANWSCFDAPIGVVLAWEERGSCLNIFRTTNRGWILETFTSYEAKDLLRKVVLMLQLESSWHWTSVDLVLTYSGRQIMIGSQEPSRITRQKTCSQVSQTRRFALYFRTEVVLMLQFESSWHGKKRGSCLNIFRTKNCGRISETFKNYEPKDLLRKSVDHVLTYSGQQIAVGAQKPSRITWQKTCCASESNMSVRVVFANRSGFDAPIGVVMALEVRGSCLNIFRMANRARRFALYLRTGVVLMLQLESSWHGRSVDHVLTYFGRKIAVGSQKPSPITRQKTYCTSESNTSVRVVFANRGGFDAPIGVFLA